MLIVLLVILTNVAAFVFVFLQMRKHESHMKSLIDLQDMIQRRLKLLEGQIQTCIDKDVTSVAHEIIIADDEFDLQAYDNQVILVENKAVLEGFQPITSDELKC